MTVDDYMQLPYKKVLQRDPDGVVGASIQELPGCLAHGADEAEALRNLRTAQALWIEAALESGMAIPRPEVASALPSGRWLQRVPRDLHRRLIELARHDRVSLNTWVTAALARAAGRREAAAGVPQRAGVGNRPAANAPVYPGRTAQTGRRVSRVAPGMAGVVPETAGQDISWYLDAKGQPGVLKHLDTMARKVPAKTKVRIIEDPHGPKAPR